MAIEFDEARLDDPEVLAAVDAQLRHPPALVPGSGSRPPMSPRPVNSSAQLARRRGDRCRGTPSFALRSSRSAWCRWSPGRWPGCRAGLFRLTGWWCWPAMTSPATAPCWPPSPRPGVGDALEAAGRPQRLGTRASGRRERPARADCVPDASAAAVVVLSLLHRFGLGPAVNAEHAAEAADMVAEESSPHRDLSQNPAKYLACGLGDADLLIWGGSVLAARASRRIADAICFYSGRHALPPTPRNCVRCCGTSTPRPVRGPFTDVEQRRPVLVLLDDEQSATPGPSVVGCCGQRRGTAGVRVCEVNAGSGSAVGPVRTPAAARALRRELLGGRAGRNAWSGGRKARTRLHRMDYRVAASAG